MMGKRRRSETARRLFRRGMNFFNAGNFRKAITYIEEAVKINPTSPEMLFALARAYQEVDDLAKSSICLDKAWDLNPGAIMRTIPVHDNKEFIRRGKKFLMKGDYWNAIENLELATVLNPFDSDVYKDLALTYEKMGDLERAYCCCAVFIHQVNLDDLVDLDGTEKIIKLEEKLDKELGDRIKKFKIRGVQDWLNNGRIYKFFGDHEKAMFCFKKVLKTAPNDKYALRYINELKDEGKMRKNGSSS